MIRSENLTKTFGRETTAINNLNCEIGEESIYGLIGSNGAGKSTFLRLIAGIYKPDSGHLYYDDEEIYGNEKLRQQIILVPDQPCFLPGENLSAMADFFSRIYERFSQEFLQELCQIFPIDLHKRLDKMSKGMQRQAYLILALSAKPRLLLLDEAFDGLDPVMRENLRRLIAREVVSEGMSCVIASHNLRELEGFCDHMALLHEGKLVYEHELESMDLGVFKLQTAFKQLPSREDLEKLGLELLHYERRGSVLELVIRGDKAEIQEKLASDKPLILDMLPLTLEELFIYVLEGKDYVVKSLIS